ncbi:unnamed protein product [Toxocara canis]|uniref:Uncharacterized protein n=1 Tax=Toxocara canis TaxID=6265 RepID=A0A183UAZ0_TOXCA|nr:unnamed protein product [Toxocara canis]
MAWTMIPEEPSSRTASVSNFRSVSPSPSAQCIPKSASLAENRPSSFFFLRESSASFGTCLDNLAVIDLFADVTVGANYSIGLPLDIVTAAHCSDILPPV